MKKKRRAIIKLSAIIVALAIGLVLCFVPIRLGQFTTFKSFSQDIRLGIDLMGGVYAVYDSSDDENQTNMSTRLQSTRDRLEGMIRSEGFTEATVVIEGSRIRVEVPDVDEPEQLFRILGEPALMTFEIYDSAEQEAENSYTGITGRMVRNAFAINYMGGFAVQLEFDRQGERLFHEVTSANIGKFIRIAVNDRTVSVAEIKEAIAGGRPVISGNFSSEEAQNLARQILSGAFDVRLTLVDSSVVSATLGQDALRNSLLAGIIGISFIIIFMLVIYKGLGVVLAIALLIYLVFMIFFLWAFPWIQLSLPGIAGIILSIGMAVDANVIIFERIKEEYRSGKSINASVMSGYKKSIWTVLDVNITSVIASVVLIVLGRGAIVGFGVTLLTGVVLSVLTAFFVSRGLSKLFLSINKTSNAFYGLYREEEPEDPEGGGLRAEDEDGNPVSVELVRKKKAGGIA
jgi:preprotein translocase subunit SecD